LGSATPDVESYYHASRGEYRLLELPERVTPAEGSPLPAVEIVDMKKELMSGNRSIFSRALAQNLNEAISGHHQSILFLNRRGGASFVQCRRCGYTMRCKRCDLALTYHMDSDQLVCHQCNYWTPVPVSCPRCSSRRIKYVGIGTQKVEEETRLGFPSARPLRWDSDTAAGKNASEDLFDRFLTEKADVLIGTQMIAKGLDLPNVTVVGVVNADISLNLPDFRAGERTYQLLSQVAGRAGRGPAGGKVIIQTYEPEHYAIKAAAAHNYGLFYSQEIEYRRQLNDPPFSRLVRLVYVHGNEERCRTESSNMTKILVRKKEELGIAGIDIIGPAPSYVNRIRGRYHWQIILRGSNSGAILSDIDFPRAWIIDVDPVGI
jgi:primosomal protein N' (replication factor Y)